MEVVSFMNAQEKLPWKFYLKVKVTLTYIDNNSVIVVSRSQTAFSFALGWP